MKILLVDDDSFLLDMYATKFAEAGYDIDTAKNGEQALDILREGKEFDAVIFDMVMPGATGMELMQTIQKEKLGGASLKYIVLSNQGEQSDVSAAMEAGAAGYIVKAESIPSKVIEKVTSILST